MKPEQTIRRQLKELRRDCIEGSDDPVLQRIAYAMETAVRWATEETKGWPSLKQEAHCEATLLRAELTHRRSA